MASSSADATVAVSVGRVLEREKDYTREALGKLFDRRSQLLVSNYIVTWPEGARLETLPWETAAQKVHESVTEALQVVSSGLLYAISLVASQVH